MNLSTLCLYIQVGPTLITFKYMQTFKPIKYMQQIPWENEVYALSDKLGKVVQQMNLCDQEMNLLQKSGKMEPLSQKLWEQSKDILAQLKPVHKLYERQLVQIDRKLVAEYEQRQSKIAATDCQEQQKIKKTLSEEDYQHQMISKIESLKQRITRYDSAMASGFDGLQFYTLRK